MKYNVSYAKKISFIGDIDWRDTGIFEGFESSTENSDDLKKEAQNFLRKHLGQSRLLVLSVSSSEWNGIIQETEEGE